MKSSPVAAVSKPVSARSASAVSRRVVAAVHDPVERILSAGRVMAIAGGLALLTIHLFDLAVLHWRVLNANLEGTVWTWASVIAAAGVSVGGGLHALMVPARRVRFAILAGAAAFLSIDDLVGLHESVANLILNSIGLSETWDSVVWPVVYLPFLAAVVLLVERLTRGAFPRIRRFALAGLGLLALAVAIEAAAAPWSSATPGRVEFVAGGVEEASELTGWTLLAVAVFAMTIGAMLRQARRDTLDAMGHGGGGGGGVPSEPYEGAQPSRAPANRGPVARQGMNP